MQKLISLLARSPKFDSSDSTATKTQPMVRLHIHKQRTNDDQTRPTFRIGKHNRNDIQKAVDLGG